MIFKERSKITPKFGDSLSSLILSKRKSVSTEGFDFACLSPFALPDMTKAVDILVTARKANKKVICVVDYDTDGITSGAILSKGFSALSIEVGVEITNRYDDGYGFSVGVLDKVLPFLNDGDVLVTADLGSSDGAQFELLREKLKLENKDVKIIVTDHHHISTTTPPTHIVDAFINPIRKDIFHDFDNLICGAAVAWFLICGLRSRTNTDFDPDTLLDFVGVATVGDMVPLSDEVNRAFVKQALFMMNSKNRRECWNVFTNQTKIFEFTEETIGFQIGPRINALSRMGDDSNNALDWLLSSDTYAIEAGQTSLNITNEERKDEQKKCQKEVLAIAKQQVSEGAFICICFAPDYTHGIVGLAASHITKELGVPAIVLSEKDSSTGSLTGSCRSIEGFDIRQLLEDVQNKTGILDKFGGHTMAAGLSLTSALKLPVFTEAARKLAKERFQGKKPEATAFYDAELGDYGTISCFNEIRKLAPFGQDFLAPTFFVSGLILSINFMGKDNAHAKIKLMNGNELIWFNCNDLTKGHELTSISAVVSLSKNVWRGVESIQLIVQSAKISNNP